LRTDAAASPPPALDGCIFKTLAFFEQRTNCRDDLVGHLVVFGVGRQRVIDANQPQPRFVSESSGRTERSGRTT
jgi:hypothetical protein